MAIRSDRALLLRRTPYGESSLVVQALTERHGRVHLLAKGAYRHTSRFFCVLDLFDTLELEWTANPRAELALLRRGGVVRRRRGLTESIGAYRAGGSMLELVEFASRPGQADEQLFGWTERALDALNGYTDGDTDGDSGGVAPPPDLVLAVFELGYLACLGLAPALETCAVCGGEAGPVRPGRAAFSAGAGGRLCARHAEEARAAGRRVGTLPLDVLEWAVSLARSDPRAPVPADLTQDQRDRVRDFIERFLGYHLEARPASHREFLSVPNRNAGHSAGRAGKSARPG